MLVAVERLIIVMGAHADRVTAAVPTDHRIAIVENPDYRRGQLSSIKRGLSAVGVDASAVILHLVDHPMVRPETFSRMVAEYQKSGKLILVARCGEHRGHPVVFDRSVFGELQHAPMEVGARAVVKASEDRVIYVNVDDPGVLLDLDTPADLIRAGISSTVPSQ
jgi:molybdenum cofactor cytidylyltransferase